MICLLHTQSYLEQRLFSDLPLYTCSKNSAQYLIIIYIWARHLMANGRGKDGSSVGFPFLGDRTPLLGVFFEQKTTADSDCSHEIRRRLLLGRKAMTNLDSVLKSRDVTLLTKVRIVKGMVFPVVTYGCESWTIKKGECQRTDAFEL